MDRQITYTDALLPNSVLLGAEKATMVALAFAQRAILGGVTALQGLGLAPTIPASMQVTVSPGSIYALDPVDASAFGDLGTDTNTILKQGILYTAQNLTLTAPTTTGFSQNYLVQAILQDLDAGSVVLPYYNAANPSDPLNGPSGSGISQNTLRECLCTISLKAGAAATTGTQTTPSPDAGNTGLYVITIANGATTITSGNISTIASAPFIPVTLPGVPAAVMSGQWSFGGASGTDTYSAAPNFGRSLLTALSTGMEILVVFANANATTTPTLNYNQLGAKSIVKQDGSAPAVSDVIGWLPLEYDGTNWRINGLVASDIRTIIPAPVLSFNRLKGSAPGSTKTASWTVEQLTASTALGAKSYAGTSLSLSFNGAATGAGGMDTGSMPVSADLSVYAIYNPTTSTWSTLGCAGSTSNGSAYSGANMPAGYAASILIYSGVANGSGNISAMAQVDRQVFFRGSLGVLSGGTVDNAFHALSIASCVPATALTVGGPCGITSSVSNTISICGASTTSAEQWVGATIASSSVNANYGPIPLFTPQTIYYMMLVGGTTTGQIWISTYSF